MSTAKSPLPTLPRSTPDALTARPVQVAVARATDSVRALAFWTATALPLVYLPLLAGDYTPTHPTVVTLITLNALALLVGHGHDPSA